jgi:hypothetical protein
MRRHAVLAQCDNWSTKLRACVAKDGPAKCAVDLARPLAQIDVIMRKVDGVKATCADAVKAHYADTSWTGKVPAMKPRELKRVMADSRARMTKACTDDKWSEPVRACIVVHGGDACFVGIGAWGFPALGIAIKTGIADCDSYSDTLYALLTCTAIPHQAVEQMLTSYQQTVPAFANMTAAQKAAAANACKASDSAIRQSATSLGCTI